jgi:hypothetical protein
VGEDVTTEGREHLIRHGQSVGDHSERIRRARQILFHPSREHMMRDPRGRGAWAAPRNGSGDRRQRSRTTGP